MFTREQLEQMASYLEAVADEHGAPNANLAPMLKQAAAQAGMLAELRGLMVLAAGMDGNHAWLQTFERLEREAGLR